MSIHRYDRDKGGTLDAAEFKKAVRLGMKIPPDQLTDTDLVRTDMCARMCWRECSSSISGNALTGNELNGRKFHLWLFGRRC